MKVLGGILLAVGLLVAAGAIGNDDLGSMYPDEATCTFAQNAWHAGIGLVAAIIGTCLLNRAAKNIPTRCY